MIVFVGRRRSKRAPRDDEKPLAREKYWQEVQEQPWQESPSCQEDLHSEALALVNPAEDRAAHQLRGSTSEVQRRRWRPERPCPTPYYVVERNDDCAWLQIGIAMFGRRAPRNVNYTVYTVVFQTSQMDEDANWRFKFEQLFLKKTILRHGVKECLCESIEP